MPGSEPWRSRGNAATLRPAAAAALLFVAVLLIAGAILVSTALAGLGAVRDLPKAFAGEPVLKNTKEGRFVVRADRMVPGQRAFGEVRVRNEGTRAGVLSVRPWRAEDTPGIGGGELSAKLLLMIRRVDRRGGLHTVWKGHLGAMGRVRVGVLRPGAVRQYRFVVRFLVRPPARGALDDDAFQGSRFTTDFVWELAELR